MYGDKDLLFEDMLEQSLIDYQEFTIEEDHKFGDESDLKIWSLDSYDLPQLTDEYFKDTLFSSESVISEQDSVETIEDTKDSEVHQIQEVSEHVSHATILTSTGNLDSNEESENSSQSEGGTRRGRPKQVKDLSHQKLSLYLSEVLTKHILKINQEIGGKRFYKF